MVRKANNDVNNGIMTTARFLQDGVIKIHRGCKDCIREFGLYRWDEKSADDRPIKENDHAMDETRYFAYTILKIRRISAIMSPFGADRSERLSKLTMTLLRSEKVTRHGLGLFAEQSTSIEAHTHTRRRRMLRNITMA